MKPTEEQFKDYVRIQYSGVTNMWDIDTVCKLFDHKTVIQTTILHRY